MNRFKAFLKLILIMGTAMTISACSKTVQWEEEVPLNTGETIWVKRSMPWVYKGGFANPFNMAMRPTGEQTIKFKYASKEYEYTGNAHVIWIAISPSLQPVLVAPALSYGWASRNSYTCVVPYYVQLIADSTGNTWTWPEKIETWLYGLPANVMTNYPKLDEGREERYFSNNRTERDRTFRLQAEGVRFIDSNYSPKEGCIHKYDPSMKPTQTKYTK